MDLGKERGRDGGVFEDWPRSSVKATHGHRFDIAAASASPRPTSWLRSVPTRAACGHKRQLAHLIEFPRTGRIQVTRVLWGAGSEPQECTT